MRSTHYLRIIEHEKLVENARVRGDLFKTGLQDLARKHSIVTAVRGRGLMAAFDLPSGDVRDAALKAFMANDVMVLSSGHRSARFRPPLNLSMDEAGEGIKRMEKALQELA